MWSIPYCQNREVEQLNYTNTRNMEKALPRDKIDNYKVLSVLCVQKSPDPCEQQKLQNVSLR